MSAFRSKADILQHGFHVRLVPGTDIGEIRLEEMAGGLKNSAASNLVLIAQGRGPGNSWASPEGEKMDTKPKHDKPTKPTDFDLETAIFGAP